VIKKEAGGSLETREIMSVRFSELET
jgi:hypothetical protein